MKFVTAFSPPYKIIFTYKREKIVYPQIMQQKEISSI